MLVSLSSSAMAVHQHTKKARSRKYLGSVATVTTVIQIQSKMTFTSQQ